MIKALRRLSELGFTVDTFAAYGRALTKNSTHVVRVPAPRFYFTNEPLEFTMLYNASVATANDIEAFAEYLSSLYSTSVMTSLSPCKEVYEWQVEATYTLVPPPSYYTLSLPFKGLVYLAT